MSHSTSRTGKRPMPSQDDARFSVPPTSCHRIGADGVQVFYRAAGETSAPVVLLLHGFPTSSFLFRELIPRLANDYCVIAPDLPGFGFTEVPPERKYPYSFDQLALTIESFTRALKLDRYATKKALAMLGTRSESTGLHPRNTIETYFAKAF